MNSIKLRLATPQDAGRLLAVYSHYVESTLITWEYEVPSRVEMEKRIEVQLEQGFPWLVAEGQDGILGYAYAGRVGERAGFDWDAQLSIYLSFNECGKGLGKALYAALLALLCKQGYYQCYALVTSPNPVSEQFHTALGFEKKACLPNAGYKLGKWIDLCVYTMQLQELTDCPVKPLPITQLHTDFVQRILERASNMIKNK